MQKSEKKNHIFCFLSCFHICKSKFQNYQFFTLIFCVLNSILVAILYVECLVYWRLLKKNLRNNFMRFILWIKENYFPVFFFDFFFNIFFLHKLWCDVNFKVECTFLLSVRLFLSVSQPVYISYVRILKARMMARRLKAKKQQRNREKLYHFC